MTRFIFIFNIYNIQNIIFNTRKQTPKNIAICHLRLQDKIIAFNKLRFFSVLIYEYTFWILINPKHYYIITYFSKFYFWFHFVSAPRP